MYGRAGLAAQPVDDVAEQHPGVAERACRRPPPATVSTALIRRARPGTADRDAQPAGGRLRVLPASRCRRASQTSTAAPNSVVTTPVGTSTPACAPSAARSSTSEPTTTSTPTSRTAAAARVPLHAGHDAGEQPHDDRRAQADEADRAGHVTAAAASSTAARPTTSRVRRTSTPSTVAGSSPRREDVQPAGGEQQADHAERDDRGEPGDRVQVALHQGAVAPREQADGVLLEQQQEHGGQRAERERDRGAGQDQPGRPGPAAGRERQHQTGGGEAADERERAGGQHGRLTPNAAAATTAR